MISDDNEFKNVISWVESQKIKNGKTKVADVNLEDWSGEYEAFKTALNCPIKGNRNAELDWILGLAVRGEYEKKSESIFLIFHTFEQNFSVFMTYIIC